MTTNRSATHTQGACIKGKTLFEILLLECIIDLNTLPKNQYGEEKTLLVSPPKQTKQQQQKRKEKGKKEKNLLMCSLEKLEEKNYGETM